MSVAAANYAVRICRLQDVAAKMVLTALAWKSHQDAPHLAFIGNEQLRQETGLKSVNGVKDALRRLVAAGGRLRRAVLAVALGPSRRLPFL